jgi:hypothetical protein
MVIVAMSSVGSLCPVAPPPAPEHPARAKATATAPAVPTVGNLRILMGDSCLLPGFVARASGLSGPTV